MKFVNNGLLDLWDDEHIVQSQQNVDLVAGKLQQTKLKMYLCCNSNFSYSLQAVADPVDLNQLYCFDPKCKKKCKKPINLKKRMVNYSLDVQLHN